MYTLTENILQGIGRRLLNYDSSLEASCEVVGTRYCCRSDMDKTEGLLKEYISSVKEA